MNDIPEQKGQAIATRPQVQAVTSAASLYDSDRFAHMQRMATALQHGTMLPRAVRGDNPNECFSNLLIVFDMAERLRVTPIALAQSVSMVHGKMVLEGKLVNAAISNVLSMRLYPWWTGERGADSYRIYLSDKPWDTGDLEKDQALIDSLTPGISILGRRIVDGSVGEWKTFDREHKPMPAWSGVQTQNQLLYRSTREWARRFEPSIMLGIYTDDEITAAEERAAARPITQSVSLSALPTGFAKDPAPAESEGQAEASAIEDAVIEEVEEQDPSPAVSTEPAQAEQAAGDATAKRAADPEEPKPAQDLKPSKAAKTPAKKPASKKAVVKTEEPAATVNEDLTVQGEGQEQGPAPDADDAYPMTATDPACPVDAYFTGLGDLMTWEEIKSGMVDIHRTDAWRALSPGDQKQIRFEVWAQAQRLIEAGVIKLDFLNDLSAFRCWLEWYPDAEGILANWDILVTMDHFIGLEPKSQANLQSAVNARVLELRGGVH